ncbi:hypothetical protein [Pseudomonas sp. URMO17WK12:I11]|uniref:hypothetical protein n=1 Tax=Pseudomonas sp. URMO17WK12:I11 TaxID=1283291 RepID=UPI000722F255|nr:hypothetical protein [Pseudomonas sp. URMO17WK12:I11]CRL48498.1 hypothetical protein PSHI_15580 [Pseudomonas sp. URMO17WK12:I11]
MSWEDVFKLLGAAILSLGGGGALVFGLSSWLGKVWAGRILGKETHRLNLEVEAAKRSLDLIKENTLRFQNDKILAYRAVVEIIARILATFDSYESNRLSATDAAARFDEFNEHRIRVYGYLAMLAPQAVMDAQDVLMDYLLKICNNTDQYEWARVREKALVAFNAIRADIGIDKSPITYNGDL